MRKPACGTEVPSNPSMALRRSSQLAGRRRTTDSLGHGPIHAGKTPIPHQQLIALTRRAQHRQNEQRGAFRVHKLPCSGGTRGPQYATRIWPTYPEPTTLSISGTKTISTPQDSSGIAGGSLEAGRSRNSWLLTWSNSTPQTGARLAPNRRLRRASRISQKSTLTCWKGTSLSTGVAQQSAYPGPPQDKRLARKMWRIRCSVSWMLTCRCCTERASAFIRLQETMLKEREDYSLLLPNLAIQLTSRLKEYGPLRSDTVVSLGPDSERAPPLAEDPSDFFVEDPNIWSYAMISNWSAAESAMGIENHHAPYLTPRGLQICLPPAVDGSTRVMSKRFDTYRRTMNFCIIIGLSGSPVGRNYVRTRAFDLVPRDGVTRREKFVHRFQSICIIHLSKRSLTHRSTHNAITGPQNASLWWTIDTASLSRIMDVEWLEKPYDALAIGPELWHRVLALRWCTRAPGETEPFLLAVGDHWAAVLYESECRRKGIKIRALQSSGGSSLEAMLVALREKVPRSGPDRVYVRLREMAVGVSYRKIATDEDYNTLTLTAHPRAGMNENRT